MCHYLIFNFGCGVVQVAIEKSTKTSYFIVHMQLCVYAVRTICP